GSRSSISSIEPLMSANSAVTVLRSPSGISWGSTDCRSSMAGLPKLAGGAGTCGLDAVVPDTSDAPHSWQNRAVDGLLKPHFTQGVWKAVPHWTQNFAVG